MRNIYIIFKRELNSYFVSPIAYIVGFIFLVICGLQFTTFIGEKVASHTYVGSFLIVILFSCPILTIKLFAEDKKNGTFELLFTSPVSTLELVLGKFFSAFFIYFILLAITLIYALFLNTYSDQGMDWGATLTAYLGLTLLGGSLVAIGVFASSLTSSQVVAAILGFGISLFFLLIYSFTQGTGEISKELSLLTHYFDFHKGIIDSQHIIYYLLWTVFSLLFANISVESQHWR